MRSLHVLALQDLYIIYESALSTAVGRIARELEPAPATRRLDVLPGGMSRRSDMHIGANKLRPMTGGFVIMSQIGGRILDARGARPAVVFGSALAAVGFYLLAGKLTDLSLSAQWIYVMIAGGGVGLMLSPASTDAVNRAPSSGYSEVTGITQTARNFGASLGLAVLGAVLISQEKTNVAGALTNSGVPKAVARRVAASFGSGAPGARSGSGSGQPASLVHDVQVAFAHSTQTVFYIMAAVMTATFLVALRLPRGRVELPQDSEIAATTTPVQARR